MIHEKNTPWAKICQYRFNIKHNNSILCRSLKRGKSVVEFGSKHIIHSGSQTSLWFDKWLPLGTLRSLVEEPLPHDAHDMTVADVLDAVGNWNWQLIPFNIPPNIIHLMLGTPRNPLGSREDLVSWEPNSNGIYSLKSAYQILSKHNTPLSSQ